MKWVASGAQKGLFSCQRVEKYEMVRAMVQIVSSVSLPTKFGDFTMVSFEGFADGQAHVALVYGEVAGRADVLCRIHSECLTGDVFGSRRCDCGGQLDNAMQAVVANGAGVILYLRQEGRGIGLVNKLRAYQLQDAGMDTVQANEALGFAADARQYGCAVGMLRALKIDSVRLMTNNPRKISALQEGGFKVERVSHMACVNTDNAAYLQTKADKLGHLILPEVLRVNKS